MTIYSGFSTRKQEERYDALIIKAVEMMNQIIITYVESTKIQPFQSQFKKIFNSLNKMDAIKHSEPKISSSFKPLASHFGVLDLQIDAISELAESNIKANQKRPQTSNQIKQKRKSTQFQRKTINYTPKKVADSFMQLNSHNKQNDGANKRYEIKYTGRSLDRKDLRSQSFSLNARAHQKKQGADDQLRLFNIGDLTMEELMEKNRLVERKMSMFRKKKYIQQAKLPARIQQLDEQEDEVELSLY